MPLANTRRPSTASAAAPVADAPAAGGGRRALPEIRLRDPQRSLRIPARQRALDRDRACPAGQLADDGVVEIERDPARRVLDEAAVAGLERAERGRQDARDRDRCAVGHRPGVGDRDAAGVGVGVGVGARWAVWASGRRVGVGVGRGGVGVGVAVGTGVGLGAAVGVGGRRSRGSASASGSASRSASASPSGSARASASVSASGVGLGVGTGPGTGGDPRPCGDGVPWTNQSASVVIRIGAIPGRSARATLEAGSGRRRRRPRCPRRTRSSRRPNRRHRSTAPPTTRSATAPPVAAKPPE